MRLAWLLSLALLSACGKTTATPPADSVEFRAADGSFSARVPGDWRATDAPAESRKAAFFGPPSGPAAYSELMGVYYHPAADPAASARSYVASQTGHGPGFTPALGVSADAGLDGSFTREGPPAHGVRSGRITTRVVAVLVPGGFYTLEHTWPADLAPDPAFEGLLRSFRPAAAAK